MISDEEKDEKGRGEPQNSTTTKYLIAKADMENALASTGWRKKGRPLRDSWRNIITMMLGDFLQHQRNNTDLNANIANLSWTENGG